MIRFVDRKQEMELLEDAWKKGGKFIVIWGRRRIGKSRLLQEFSMGKPVMYHLATNASQKIQIRELKQEVAKFYNDSVLRNLEINSWKDLFDYLGSNLLGRKKGCLILDEFSYFIKSDKSVLSAMQAFIDNHLRKTKSIMIVSGSMFGLMSEQVLSYASPLYGRRDRDIRLGPLPIMDSVELLEKGFKEGLRMYLALGGIPEYLRIAREYPNLEKLLEREFLDKFGYFYREPYFILSEEFKEIKTYMSILEAVATGHNRPTEIANHVGIKSREVYPYLDLLINYGFLKKETSIFSKKKSIYIMDDPMLDTWFNFVLKKRERIEAGSAKIEKQELNQFLGKRFEEFIRELLSGQGMRVGRWWHKDKEIDIVGVKGNKIVIGECKWKDRVNARKVLDGLTEKTKEIEWDGKKEYVIFAKSFKKRIDEPGVRCFDLKDIEKMVKTKRQSW